MPDIEEGLLLSEKGGLNSLVLIRAPYFFVKARASSISFTFINSSHRLGVDRDDSSSEEGTGSLDNTIVRSQLSEKLSVEQKKISSVSGVCKIV